MDAHNVQSTYDAWSAAYDETPNPLIPVEEIVVRSLLRMLEFQRVLDAATGTGRYALYLAEQGKHVAAFDDNEKMLAVARRKAQARQLAIDFRHENVAKLSYADASFDLVICALALAHVKDLNPPCQEFVRVLRQNGHLIITDLHPQFRRRWGLTIRNLSREKNEFFQTIMCRLMII